MQQGCTAYYCCHGKVCAAAGIPAAAPPPRQLQYRANVDQLRSEQPKHAVVKLRGGPGTGLPLTCKGQRHRKATARRVNAARSTRRPDARPQLRPQPLAGRAQGHRNPPLQVQLAQQRQLLHRGWQQKGQQLRRAQVLRQRRGEEAVLKPRRQCRPAALIYAAPKLRRGAQAAAAGGNGAA